MSYRVKFRIMSRIRGPQRRPWQLPLPEPVHRLMSSFVHSPSSSAFQNTRFLMPLQMHTTFIPSTIERDDESCLAGASSSGGVNRGAGSEAPKPASRGVARPSSDGAEPFIQSGTSSPIFEGSRSANPPCFWRDEPALKRPLGDADLVGRLRFIACRWPHKRRSVTKIGISYPMRLGARI
jgi:hypothetical protein